MFLIDVAEFNKQLSANVRGFFRTIGGKVVPVKSHSRRYVMATKQALKDLQNRGKTFTEGAYIINPHGMVSKFIQGSDNNVNIYNAMPHIKKQMQYQRPNTDLILSQMEKADRSPFSILHNHPVSQSLSNKDFNNTTKIKQIYAINIHGSIFRGYKLDGFDNKEHLRGYNTVLENLLNEHPTMKIRDLEFLATHVNNRRLANQGKLFYRSKLSRYDKNVVNKYKSTIDKLLTAENLERPVKLNTLAKYKLDVVTPIDKFKPTYKPNPRIRLETRENDMKSLVSDLEDKPKLKLKQKEQLLLQHLGYGGLSKEGKLYSSDLKKMEKLVKQLKSKKLIGKDETFFDGQIT